MKFLLQAITIISMQLGRAVMAQAKSAITPELMDYMNRSARRVAMIFAVRLFLALASFSGFILAFTEAMRLLDSFGTIKGTAMLLGSFALCLFSAILFFAIGHRVPKSSEVEIGPQEATTPKQEIFSASGSDQTRPDLMGLDDGLAVLMNELREERQRFQESRLPK